MLSSHQKREKCVVVAGDNGGDGCGDVDVGVGVGVVGWWSYCCWSQVLVLVLLLVSPFCLLL